MQKKSLLALLLVLCMMLGLLAGCGSAETSTAEASSAESQTEAASVAEEAEVQEEPAEEAEAPAEEPASAAEEAEEPAAVMGPYEPNEDHVEVTMLFQYAAFFQGFFPEGWASSPWWEEFGEATNTSWTLREVANTAWQENVNLLCASGDLPDVVSNIGTVYNGGLAQAIRDEMIVDLAPYLEEYAPNYFSYLTTDDYTVKTMLTDDGEIGSMSPLVTTAYSETDGLWIRQDWLDELGMSIPTTPDELEEVLVAFRDSFGADVGFYQMIRSNTGLVGIDAEGIWNAYGPTNFYLDEDGNVQFGPMQDYYYEYLQFLKNLASEGMFLTSEFTDKSSADLFASGGIGIEGDSPDNVPSYISLLDEEERAKINLVPMPALGEPSEYGTPTSLVTGANGGGGAISISTNCENVEAVIHALDYLFTEEGSLLASFGIEGLTYEYVDGEPVFTELILSNPDGIPVQAATGYWSDPALPGLIVAERTWTNWDDVQKSAYGIWETAYTGSSMTLPTDSLSLTEEEQDSISVYKSDMVTYATQWVNEVIFGDTELTDAEIESFQQTLVDTMHINEIIEIYQAAYDRFQERSLG